MPRNLQDEKDSGWHNIANLEKSSDEVETTYENAPMASHRSASPQQYDLSSNSRGSAVKPYVQALTFLDLDSCVKLEEVTFPPEERCSREKVSVPAALPHIAHQDLLFHNITLKLSVALIYANPVQFHYRFAKCSELSLGLFTSADTTIATASTSQPTTANPGSAETAATAVPVYSGTPERKSILLGHVIATKTTNLYVRDEDMELPPKWREEHQRGIDSPSTVTPAGTPKLGASSDSKGSALPGHKEEGRTICIHSLAVLPDFQGKGLGRLLMRSYIQRMESSGVADRIAIIAHDQLVPFYEGMGFESRGKSPVVFGGGNWVDMVLDLRNHDL
ncbi:acetyltransferase (GNAT) domain-containing protein 6 [Elsinoe australis]|uniref:Acetyltransferase (GNAT) domain-containing protein 6 n=1 Tax=Elsinoe australis TaxID=40998 RepID=A0A4U7B6I0_9PEZI|nr:acetyltransferase (GNAT) domain-containing protein 6 [Elsinoe australis]